MTTDELTVIPYEGHLSTQWDAAVVAAMPTHFMFQRAFVDYHARRLDEASILLAHDDKIVAAIPATRSGTTVTSHGGLTFGTVLAAGRCGLPRMLRLVEKAAAHFKAEGATEWLIKPLPHIYHSGAGDDDICALMTLGAQMIRRDTATAIHPGHARALSTERRRALRRAARADLDVGPSTAIDAFMDLVREILEARHQTSPVHTTDEMRLLASRFPDAIRLFTATGTTGTIEAGVLTFWTDTVIHAQYIAASDDGRRSGALDLVVDHLVTNAQSTGRWFDFGISNERDGSLNHGLIRNKEGFGGRSIAYDRYLLPLTASDRRAAN